MKKDDDKNPYTYLSDLLSGKSSQAPTPTSTSFFDMISSLSPAKPTSDQPSNIPDFFARLVETSPPPDTSLAGLFGTATPLGTVNTAASIFSPPRSASLPLPPVVIGPPILSPSPRPLGQIEPTEYSVSVFRCQSLVQDITQRKVTVNSGRVLPTIDDLAILEARRIRAAFLYSDLHGFTKIVASSPTRQSVLLIQAFLEILVRITTHYGGSVVDCAGDRVLSVFHRPETDYSPDPVREAITAALWTQTVLQRVIAPAFRKMGLPGDVSAAMGIDYGSVAATCVGIRNNKRFVFSGDSANNAAKLQELGQGGEIIISASAYVLKPTFLNHPSWSPYFIENRVHLRQAFADSVTNPPKP